MDDIIKALSSSLVAIIIAIAGVIIAYLNKTKRDLEKDKKKLQEEIKNKETQIQIFNNGFREEIHTELKKLNNKECVNCKKGKKE